MLHWPYPCYWHYSALAPLAGHILGDHVMDVMDLFTVDMEITVEELGSKQFGVDTVSTI